MYSEMHIWCYNIKNYYMKHSKNGVFTVFKLMVKLSPHPRFMAIYSSSLWMNMSSVGDCECGN